MLRLGVLFVAFASLTSAFTGQASADVLERLFGPKRYHLFHCHTEEAARKCGSDCWPNADGYYEFNANAGDHSVAAKFVGSKPGTSSIDYFRGCDISGSMDWTCVRKNTLRGDITISENKITLSSVNGEVWELFGGGVGSADGSRWTDFDNNSFCYK